MKRFSAGLIRLLTCCGLLTGCFGSSDKINWFLPDGSVSWEAEKQQSKIITDTIVIHHTGGTPGMTWRRLSEIQYSSLYVPRYQSDDPEPYVKGQQPRSGHFREIDGKKVQVFYAYHWLVRQDGTIERLLKDEEVGWHCGSWPMNNRSIALCFDGDYRTEAPPEAALDACAKLIAEYQKRYKIVQAIGHFEVKPTECPGEWFSRVDREKLLVTAKFELAPLPRSVPGRVPIVRLSLSPADDPEGLAPMAAEVACFTAVAQKLGKKVTFKETLYALPKGCPQKATLPKYGMDMVAIPKLAARFEVKAEYRKNLPIIEAAKLIQQGRYIVYRVGNRQGRNRYGNIVCSEHGQHYVCLNVNTVVVTKISTASIEVMDPVRGYTTYTPNEFGIALKTEVFDHEAVIFPSEAR